MWSALDDSAYVRYAGFDDTEIDSSLDRTKMEIGETAESKAKCLETLRTKLKELDDIYPCLDEVFLLSFLRVAKFDCAKAFIRLKKFYEKQEIQQKAFKNCRLSYTTVRQFPYLTASPYRMPDNSLLIMSKFATVDPSKISFDEKFYLELIVYSHLIRNPLTQMCGVTVIIDFTGYNLRSFLSHPLHKLKVFIETFQNSFPVRIKMMHVLNTPLIFKTAYNVVFPLMTKKLQNRMALHPKDDNFKSLHASVPSEILSEEYGGQLKKSELVDLLENISELDRDYRKQLTYGYVKNRLQREKFSIFKDD